MIPFQEKNFHTPNHRIWRKEPARQKSKGPGRGPRPLLDFRLPNLVTSLRR